MLTALTIQSSKAVEVSGRCLSGRISYAFLQFHRNHSNGTHSMRKCLDLHSYSKGGSLHEKWRTPPSFFINSRGTVLRASLYADKKEEGAVIEETASGEDQEIFTGGGARGGRYRSEGKEVLGRHLIEDRIKVIPVETSIRLMKSAAYGDDPFWVSHRRNFPGQCAPKQTKRTCIRQRQLTTGNPSPNKPSLDQLQKVFDTLQATLEKIFTHPLDYTIYRPDILFIDNIRNLRVQGLEKYIQQVALLKIVGHVKFAFVKFEIINMSMDPEEGRITMRWRIKGLSGLRVMLKFWKYKLWKWQEIAKHQETWYDGVSYFDVDGNGKVFQHIADKVMEDKQREVSDKRARGSVPLAAKLGALATVFPTPSLTCGHESRSSTIASVQSS